MLVSNANTRFALPKALGGEQAERDPDYGDKMPRFEGINMGKDDPAERDTDTGN
ncbi:uncharacterized protein RAG0_02487 [Rhynchosporium agropyri]|uniref:Uncharacterized protein n=3 Tax=Rhynchosporium TaxID=38037 RepID=A0A1E1MCU9_RHYSE|nr:uncharacterized protein RAG0_02487 [Rhynchosporium agropyri]CZT04601.1 uncharacterized protein RCO7_05500 [Rhynchosporium commune]CZT46565.1 uncharacterized protein RSE6_07011 [Rhynchosporium secalis]